MQISLIEFSVENHRIFKERATFSLATRKNDGHTFESNGENLLKASLIYGPNASGKSSLLDALDTLRGGILFSANTSEDFERTSKLPHDPFLGSVNTKTQPSLYEVVFSLSETAFDGIYKYKFSILPDHVVTESLVEFTTSGEERSHLNRSGQQINTSDLFKGAQILVDQGVGNNALFVTAAALLKHPFALTMISAFKNLNIISGVHSDGYKGFTVKEFKKNSLFKRKILQYLRTADFCIKDGLVEEINDSEADDSNAKVSLSKRVKKDLILFFEHPIWGDNEKQVGTFRLGLRNESIGTVSFLNILGPVTDTLESGKVLFIDELDNSLHPLLTKFIIDLFESKEINVKNAQLVATTHDTSLLSYKDEFIRDQFWFTEKDEFGAAKLFSLAEFDLRNDTEFSRKYLEGRFGALPFIGSVEG